MFELKLTFLKQPVHLKIKKKPFTQRTQTKDDDGNKKMQGDPAK